METSEILKLKNGKKIAAVIPARMASTRFPNKPMAKILNKEMIVWVMNGAASSQLVDQVIVATDHKDIANVVEKNGGVAVMTDSDLPSGSDRIWAAIKDKDFDIVVNVQGDEPLIEGAVIDAAILPLLNMESNPGSAIDMSTLAHEISYNELMSENAVKVVVDQNQVALYFSRLPIPYSKSSDQEKCKQQFLFTHHSLDLSSNLSRTVRNQKPVIEGCLKHIGLYAYHKAFLKKYCESSPVFLEQKESLEQLRALYLGAKIKVVPVDFQSHGVDIPEDILKVEKILNTRM